MQKIKISYDSEKYEVIENKSLLVDNIKDTINKERDR